VSTNTVGLEMYGLIRELYPVCRSITGDGLRFTLRRLQRDLPLTIHEVPTGTRVFDWTVPKEWNIRDAYIKTSRGDRIVDFHKSNLHVVNYSVPMSGRFSLAELKPHLFSLPDRPEWIPYRSSYYAESWGFCLAHNALEELSEDLYEVCIESRLEPGSLSYGDLLIPGDLADEVLISCHTCHPSLANDNLSGIAVAVQLARALSGRRNRYSYRFLFIPGTIGSITWLARNEAQTRLIRHGVVLTGVGDRGHITYKRSRQGTAAIDQAFEHALRTSGRKHEVQDFVPYGYDERQYCSPGFNLRVGCLMRTPNGKYPQYHTSADDLDFVDASALADTLDLCLNVFDILEHDEHYQNLNPKCEPQLGRRGLYSGVTGRSTLPGYELALLWVLNYSDGEHSLLKIAERANMPFAAIRTAATNLRAAGLLEIVDQQTSPETQAPAGEAPLNGVPKAGPDGDFIGSEEVGMQRLAPTSGETA
jgi:aminopeptidase-like protein